MHTIHFHPWFRIELLKARQRFTIGTLSRSLQFILVQQLQLQNRPVFGTLSNYVWIACLGFAQPRSCWPWPHMRYLALLLTGHVLPISASNHLSL